MRSKVLPCTIPSTTAPMPISTPGMILGCAAGASWPLSYGLGYPAQALQSSHKALALAHELLTPSTWLLLCLLPPCFISSARRGKPPKSGPRLPLPSLPTKGFLTGWRWELSCGAGCWPSKDKEKRGLHKCTRAWLSTGPQEQRRYGRISRLAGRDVWESGAGRRGLNTLAEALSLVDKNGERFYEAELYRIKGH